MSKLYTSGSFPGEPVLFCSEKSYCWGWPYCSCSPQPWKDTWLRLSSAEMFSCFCWQVVAGSFLRRVYAVRRSHSDKPREVIAFEVLFLA